MKKVLYWIGGSVLGIIILSAIFGGSSTTTVSNQQQSAPAISQPQVQQPSPAPIVTAPAPTPTPTVTTPAPVQTAPSKTYTNSDGNTVQSPTYSSSVPAGATAVCRDGSYSFSQHRSGTCSHHGGVAEWL